MSVQTSVVKQFNVKTLNVPGAELIESPVYGDLRGTLYESFHVLKLRTNCSIHSILGIYPPRHAVYGPVSHVGEEYVYLIRGQLFVERRLEHRYFYLFHLYNLIQHNFLVHFL